MFRLVPPFILVPPFFLFLSFPFPLSSSSSSSSSSSLLFSSSLYYCLVVPGLCYVCHQPVRGLHVWCQSCAHGGHIECIRAWFETETQCPTGCGHQCEYGWGHTYSYVYRIFIFASIRYCYTMVSLLQCLSLLLVVHLFYCYLLSHISSNIRSHAHISSGGSTRKEKR